MRLLCFGDSNTYGYDPCTPLGGRYPADVRWTDVLARETAWEVLNAGMNGRAIPCRSAETQAAARLVRDSGADLVIVMLGSNDLLCEAQLTAENAATRMEAFLRSLPDVPVLLIAPPPMQRGEWVTEARLVLESARLAEQYAALAGRLPCGFADAGSWGVELTFDGVHFTESGHRAFAKGLASCFRM